MLSENRELMDKLAAHLIEKETITGKEFMSIYRKEKGLPEPEEKEEIEAKSIKSSIENSIENNVKNSMEERTEETGGEPDISRETGQESSREKSQWEGQGFSQETDRKDVPQEGNGSRQPEEDATVRQPENAGPVGRFSNASGNFEDTLQKKIDEQK